MNSMVENDARLEYERQNRSPTDLDLEPITSEDEDYESAPPDYQICIGHGWAKSKSDDFKHNHT